MRWGTALYRLKTSSTKVALILALMAEGVDVSALERVFGIREGTLLTWLTRAGLQAGKVHRHFFHHLCHFGRFSTFSFVCKAVFKPIFALYDQLLP